MSKVQFVKGAGKKCFYCGGKMENHGRSRSTSDHKQPLSRGGSREPWNLLRCCQSCNEDKHNLDFEEYRVVLSFRKGLLDAVDLLQFFGERHPEEVVEGFDKP